MYKFGQEINVEKLCRKENIAYHVENHSGFHLSSHLYLPPFFFSFYIFLWWCQMLTPSYLRQPVPHFHRSAVLGCLLQLSSWSLCIQQSGLSIGGQGKIPPGVGAIVSPQPAAAQEGSGLGK